MEFARRGFAVAVVLRRGYGKSGGGWAETYGTCTDTQYKQAAFTASKDLHAAIEYLGTLPQFDIDRMIAVGVSAGGFATVALTADSPPKGLLAAISFAGGRGSNAHDSVCQEDALISTFGLLGKTSRTPMLWVYAKNDHFFNSTLAKKLYKAFTASGGNATLVQPPAYGEDGHFLFSTAGIPTWTPIVDTFLKKQNIVLVDELLPLPSVAKLKAPAQLSAKNKKVFATYLQSPPHKAFAVDENGGFGWRSGRRTIAEAKKEAMDYCQQYTSSQCELYAVDDEYAK
jgi:dienelactone hydrolase